MKGWYGDKTRHELASKGIRTRACGVITHNKAGMKDIFKNVSWLKSALIDSLVEVIQEEYDYALREMYDRQDQFKYLNDFEHIYDEAIARFVDEHDEGIDSYIPRGFEYVTNDPVNKLSVTYTFLAENPEIKTFMKDMYEKEMQNKENFKGLFE